MLLHLRCLSAKLITCDAHSPWNMSKNVYAFLYSVVFRNLCKGGLQLISKCFYSATWIDFSTAKVSSSSSPSAKFLIVSSSSDIQSSYYTLRTRSTPSLHIGNSLDSPLHLRSKFNLSPHFSWTLKAEPSERVGNCLTSYRSPTQLLSTNKVNATCDHGMDYTRTDFAPVLRTNY